MADATPLVNAIELHLCGADIPVCRRFFGRQECLPHAEIALFALRASDTIRSAFSAFVGLSAGRRPRLLGRRNSFLYMRIGSGYDTHRLTPGRSLRLGGFDVPHDRQAV